MANPTNTREKAVQRLLSPPAIQYVRSLEKLTKGNPDYIKSNREDVGNIIHGFLVGGGFHWHRDIFEKEWPEILQEALARLASKKTE
jgi:hypothetical protein